MRMGNQARLRAAALGMAAATLIGMVGCANEDGEEGGQIQQDGIQQDGGEQGEEGE